MAHSYAQFRNHSIVELIQLYDREAPHVQPGLAFLRQEIALHDLEEQNRQLTKVTRGVWLMTGVTTVATIVNVVLFALR